jgi:predicted transcriptional regulator
MKKRTKTDIAAQILYAAIGGSTKTKIMYQTFLTYRHVKDYYIPLLIEGGLLETDESEALYNTTEKGKRFLRIYEQLEGFLEIADVTLKKDANKRAGQ